MKNHYEDFQTTICIGDRDDLEIEVEFSGGYFQAGCRSGHPDNWTPDEGEDPEIHAVWVLDENGRRTTEDLLPKLTREQVKRLADEAFETREQRARDSFDDEPYDAYDD